MCFFFFFWFCVERESFMRLFFRAIFCPCHRNVRKQKRRKKKHIENIRNEQTNTNTQKLIRTKMKRKYKVHSKPDHRQHQSFYLYCTVPWCDTMLMGTINENESLINFIPIQFSLIRSYEHSNDFMGRSVVLILVDYIFYGENLTCIRKCRKKNGDKSMKKWKHWIILVMSLQLVIISKCVWVI